MMLESFRSCLAAMFWSLILLIFLVFLCHWARSELRDRWHSIDPGVEFGRLVTSGPVRSWASTAHWSQCFFRAEPRHP